MKTRQNELKAIPLEFVVGHAQTKKTDGQRKPYAELIQSWAEHEGLAAEGLEAVRRLAGGQQTDADHMPKELFQQYRSGTKAQQLIDIIGQINDAIMSGKEIWTWAHVMRVMIDEGILLTNVTVNRFDAIICSMIPAKGRDTVRKNGKYDIVRDRNDTYRSWVSNSHINPVQASDRDICCQIAQLFLPILTLKTTALI